MTDEIILEEADFSLSFCSASPHGGQGSFTLPGALVEEGGYILQERIIVPPELADKAEVFSVRRLAPDRCNRPLVLIGHPCLPVQYAAVIARKKGNAASVENVGQAMKVSAEGMTLLYSAPLLSGTARSMASMSAPFQAMRRLLSESGMRETDIARTWLYMDDILEDYMFLNEARDAFFREACLPPGHFYPASTGIEGHLADNRPLSLEFCAFSGENLFLRRLPSPLQNEPTSYGKLFSRAVAVQFPVNCMLFISGTAAIGKDGNSLFPGDVISQLVSTLDIILGIIENAGGGFRNIAQAIVYIKRSDDFDVCLAILKDKGFPCERSLIQVETSVCRDELLCEIEATVILP